MLLRLNSKKFLAFFLLYFNGLQAMGMQHQESKDYFSVSEVFFQPRKSRSTDSSSETEQSEPYLNIVEEMQNRTLFSGEKVLFKCKVEGYPIKNLTFIWYKDNNRINPSDSNEGMRISVRNSVSKLEISDVYTADTGWYRCEVSNSLRRVHTQAYVLVSFNPLPNIPDQPINEELLQGRCEFYNGVACMEHLKDKQVYLESFQDQAVMESEINSAIYMIDNLPSASAKCRHYSKAAFCFLIFPLCEEQKNDLKPTEVRLCREDCDLLKYDTCRKEFYEMSPEVSSISQFINDVNCSLLPPTTTKTDVCIRLGLPRVVREQHKCYNDSGATYRGTLSMTIEGDNCQPWPNEMLAQYPELSGGHNFCRNPGDEFASPWCYIDTNENLKEICQVPSCDHIRVISVDIMMILIPAIGVPIVLGFFILGFCLVCKRKGNSRAKHTKGIKMETRSYFPDKNDHFLKVHIDSIKVLEEIGNGKFGKLYKVQVYNNQNFPPTNVAAFKSISMDASILNVEDFKKEVKVLATLTHDNIANLQAVVVDSSLRGTLFEYSNNVDLHEYLVAHSPQSDLIKPVQPNVRTSNLDHQDFLAMAIQIASGMEYLTSNNYIHRDLAARNVLICGNRDLKISNLGVLKDSHLSCYYRSPKGGQMLPIRWMAPESLQNWQFSDKSPVWSFGVLLWELFSYGSHPYCGYSNHEVLDMISRRQLLPCPDQCPAKIYSLMHECWTAQPMQRPHFKIIQTKLLSWKEERVTMTSIISQSLSLNDTLEEVCILDQRQLQETERSHSLNLHFNRNCAEEHNFNKPGDDSTMTTLSQNRNKQQQATNHDLHDIGSTSSHLSPSQISDNFSQPPYFTTTNHLGELTCKKTSGTPNVDALYSDQYQPSTYATDPISSYGYPDGEPCLKNSLGTGSNKILSSKKNHLDQREVSGNQTTCDKSISGTLSRVQPLPI